MEDIVKNIVKIIAFTAIFAFLFEYFVLVRLYKREPNVHKWSLIIAPLMAIAIIVISMFIFKTVSPWSIFLIAVAIELVLSYGIGYKLEPEASVLERSLVAASVMTVAFLGAKQLALVV